MADDPTSPVADAGAPEAPRPDAGPASRWTFWLIRLGATAAALALWWWIARVSLAELLEALGRIAPLAALVALALTFGNLGIGAVRWHILMRAYGAVAVPPIAQLARTYLIGLFFNTFLPANVGGDVFRAHVTRKAFPRVPGAYLIVLVERVFGLAGLFLLASAVLLVHPIPGIEVWVAALCLMLALSGAASPLLIHLFGRRLPWRLRELARALPSVHAPRMLLGVLFLSVCTQTVAALTGHALIDSLWPAVSLGDSLVLIPVALISVYLPTIAGLGARETAFVVLFGTVGVPEADATAASLAMLAVHLVVALTGGLVHVLAPARSGP
ncbi:MAG: flippase-like domain-containing protein [Deltaproteobacteria bacterium]|nr:MAG: flippase-like domain-containing protein [Deltaproteobacteria bacterium]